MNIDVEENHPDILVWLKAIREANESNKNPIDYFQEKLFKGSKKPPQFIRNILNELLVNGFLNPNYTLTEKGEKALKDSIIYLPQEGIYEILVINDPLFPQIILDFDELNPDLHAQLSYKSKDNSNAYKTIELPRFIFDAQNIEKIKTINKKSKKSIIVSKIDTKGNRVKEEKQASIKIEIDESFNLKLNLFYRNEYHNLTSPISDVDKIIEELLSKISKLSDLDLYRIPVSYDDISSTERRTFQKGFSLSKIVLSELYEFDNATIEQVNIYPKDLPSANRWVQDLLMDSISTYITAKELEKIWIEVSNNFAFNNYHLQKIEKKHLLEKVSFGSKKFWFLIAPEDLGLEWGLLHD